MIEKIENIAYNQHNHIGRIIKPSIAIKPDDVHDPKLLTYQHYSTDDKETANLINEYFNSIGHPSNPNYHNNCMSPDQVREFDRPYDFDPSAHPNHQQELNKLTAPLTESELLYHLKRIKNNKQTYDYHEQFIHPLMLKNCFHQTKTLFLMIFDYWKDTGDTYPDENTRAINPEYKPSKLKEYLKSLRPVSRQKVIWKWFEMAIDHRGLQYLENLNILHPDQYAAQKACGSEDCLIDLCMDIQQILQTQPVHMSIFDSSDAFDSIKLKILYDKLRYHCGFNDHAVTMFKSILENRKSITIVNGTQSDPIPTLSGPYQGSYASDTCWVVYINPLLHYINDQMITTVNNNGKIQMKTKVNIKSFMDDLKIYTKIFTSSTFKNIPMKHQNDMITNFQKAINQIKSYLNINNIPTNDSKTQIITFKEFSIPKNDPIRDEDISIFNKFFNIKPDANSNDPLYKYRNAEFMVNNVVHPKSETVKVLGLMLDNEWSFSLHIKYITNKMKLIRIKCIKLIANNKIYMNMHMIRDIIQSSGFQLLNYAGCMFLNQRGSISPLRTEYNKNMRLLSPSVPSIPIAASTHFHHFHSFEIFKLRINAKYFSKFLRISNGVSKYRKKYLRVLI